MEDIARKISLYHNLFLVCLVLCILCLILAIVLFFVLDMRSVIGYLTGRRAKKQIQALEASNAASGRLIPRERSNMQYVASEMKADMGVRGAAVPGARKVDNVIQNVPKPEIHVQEGTDATSLLQENTGGQETTLLKENTNEQQTVLSQGGTDDSTAMLDGTQMKMGTFVIEREIILIHAEEVI